jgi:hypothetical protein
MVCPFSGPVYPRANGDQSADITRLCLSDKRSIRCVSPNVAHLRHAGMSAPWSLTGAKRTSGKLCSTSVSHNHAASQLPYPRADSLPRSGLVQDDVLRH